MVLFKMSRMKIQQMKAKKRTIKRSQKRLVSRFFMFIQVTFVFILLQMILLPCHFSAKLDFPLYIFSPKMIMYRLQVWCISSDWWKVVFWTLLWGYSNFICLRPFYLTILLKPKNSNKSLKNVLLIEFLIFLVPQFFCPFQ